MFAKRYVCALAAAAAVASSSTSEAALTAYTSRSSFLAAVSASGTDGFDGFDISNPTPGSITRAAGNFGYSADTGPSGFLGAGTASNPWLSTNFARDGLIFYTFTPFGSVTAIGGNFFGSDFFGQFAPGDVVVTVADSFSAISVTITGATTSSFLGFTTDGFSISRLEVVAVQPSSGVLWPTVDNLTLGTAAAIPEPSGYAQLTAGLIMLGGIARVRRTYTQQKKLEQRLRT